MWAVHHQADSTETSDAAGPRKPCRQSYSDTLVDPCDVLQTLEKMADDEERTPARRK
jgi:hypothetical protein